MAASQKIQLNSVFWFGDQKIINTFLKIKADKQTKPNLPGAAGAPPKAPVLLSAPTGGADTG